MGDEPITVKPASAEQAVFAEALLCDTPAARAAYLDSACGTDTALRQRVEALLRAAENAGDFLEEPPTGLSEDAEPTRLVTELISEKPGDKIGRYKLLQQIGEGGCGVVYMAEQLEPVRRRVALKVIKLGMDTKSVIARFETERQALALMDHPNIAKVFDGGATETGRPYFVMELVRGIKITDYCDQNNLSTEERLNLFTQVCHAIQHAHQKGIIHRDIKPSNVLVTISEPGSPGCPKVIDFGIAKATTDQPLTDKTVFTAFEQFMGTPAYMSPEQAMMTSRDIDTRTDIYALGVLLYELLTGKTPFDGEQLLSAGLDEMRRVIREEQPPRPSTRLTLELKTNARAHGVRGQDAAFPSSLDHRAASNLPPRSQSGDMSPQSKEPSRRVLQLKSLIHLVRGDLDWIVMKCLEKERSRRYDTANGLAADITRHLKNEPVIARPPSAAYKFEKAFRRNRLAFAAAMAVVLALLFGVMATIWQAVRATKAEQAATEDQHKTKQALEAETQAKGALEQTLAREQRSSYFHRITLAHRELLENNLLKAEELLDECPTKHRAWEWYYLKRLCRVDPVTLRGQLGVWFQKVAFSPDGRRLASASEDKTVKVWDATTGEELLVLPDTGEVRCVAFRPREGRWLVTGDTNGDVKFWDTVTRQVVRTLRRHTGTVLGVAFSPDGHRLASAGEDKTVNVWDATSGGLLHTLKGHELSVSTVAFSPDGQSLASGSLDSTVRFWDTATGKEIRTLRGHQDPVTGLAFSPDGRRLATGSFDSTVKVWDVPTGQATLTLRGQPVRLNGVAFIDEGRRIASVSDDKTMKIWDAMTGEVVLSLRGHLHDLTGVASSPDGRRLASVSQDRTTRIWDATPLGEAPAGQEALTLRGHTEGIWGMDFSPDGNRLASASGDKTVRVWDTRTGLEDLAPFRKHVRVVFSVAFSPDGQRLASGSAQLANDEPGYLKVWDATTGQEILQPHGNDVEAFAVAFSPDSRWLVTGNRVGNVSVWNATNGQVVHTLDARGPQVFGLAFSPDSRRLVTLSAEGVVTVHDATRWGEKFSQEPLVTFRAHKTPVRASLAFGLDGKRLVVPGDENTVNIWDVTTTDQPPSTPLLTLRGHTAQVWGVAFSPDGRWVASGSEDNTVKLWDARAGGEPVRTYRGHSGVVTRVAFSPDGKRLASASRDRTVKIWDAQRWDNVPDR